MNLNNSKSADPFIGVAPMEGVTDFPARLWFRLIAPWNPLCTPFIRVTEAYPPQHLPLSFCPELTELKGYLNYELIPQILTTKPARFVQIAEKILEHSPVVDFNCGCPAPKVISKKGGSALLADAEAFCSLIEHLAHEIGASRLSVKMRLGIHDPDEFYDLFNGIASLPLYWLNIHGRTQKEGYRGLANWKYIQYAAQKAAFPVVASGDIVSYSSYAARLDVIKALPGIFIGRGCLRNPWLYHEIRGQKAAQLPVEVLLTALDIYALLVLTADSALPLLIEMVKSLDFNQCCGVDTEKWRLFSGQLRKKAYELKVIPEPEACLNLTTRLLGRVKMVWCHLRSSLHPHFKNSQVLTAKSYAELRASIQQLVPSVLQEQDSSSLFMTHKSEWDHVFGK
jgi:tRNA-dihydrouridine synthase